MMNDFANATTEELVTQIVARDVALGVEMARSIGHRMPVEYDVGFSRRVEQVLVDGTSQRIKLRLDDAFYEVRVFVPHMDGRCSLRKVDDAWREIMTVIHSASTTLAHVWLEKHPEARISNDQLKLALKKLDVVKRDDVAEERWIAACRKKAQAARFQKVQ